MIFDSIKNLESYRDMPKIYKALKYLSGISADNMPSESVEIDGRNIFANPVSLTSKPVDQCIFEAHKRYIDIHYIISGVEGISTRDIALLHEQTPIDKDKDIGFFTGEESGTYFLQPRDFMVCFPHDAHRVAMMQDKPCDINKIVVKVLY